MKHAAVFEKIIEEEPAWLAREIIAQGKDSLEFLFNSLGPGRLAPVLECLPPVILVAIAQSTETPALFGALSDRKSAELLRVLQKSGEENLKSVLLASKSDSARKSVEKLARFAEESVGAAMDPAPLTSMSEQAVGEVLALMRKKKLRNNRYIHVVDQSGVLKGVLSFKDAYYADEHKLLSSLLGSKLVTLRPETSIASLDIKKHWLNWSSLPVVDAEGVLLGALRQEDVLSFEPSAKSTAVSGFSWAAEEAVELLEQGMRALPETFGATKS